MLATTLSIDIESKQYKEKRKKIKWRTNVYFNITTDELGKCIHSIQIGFWVLCNLHVFVLFYSGLLIFVPVLTLNHCSCGVTDMDTYWLRCRYKENETAAQIKEGPYHTVASCPLKLEGRMSYLLVLFISWYDIICQYRQSHFSTTLFMCNYKYISQVKWF